MAAAAGVGFMRYAPMLLKGTAGLSAANMIGLRVPLFSDIFNAGADTVGMDVGQGGLTQTITKNPMLIIILIVVFIVVLSPNMS